MGRRSIYALVIGLVVWIRGLRVFVIRLQQQRQQQPLYSFLLRGGNVLVDVEFHDPIDELRVLQALSDFVFICSNWMSFRWEVNERTNEKKKEIWKNNHVKIASLKCVHIERKAQLPLDVEPRVQRALIPVRYVVVHVAFLRPFELYFYLNCNLINENLIESWKNNLITKRATHAERMNWCHAEVNGNNQW